MLTALLLSHSRRTFSLAKPRKNIASGLTCYSAKSGPKSLSSRRAPNKRPLVIYEHVHPIVRFIFEEARRQNLSIQHLADKAGMDRVTILKWKDTHSPSLSNAEAALNALGHTIKIDKNNDPEPPCLGDYYLVSF